MENAWNLFNTNNETYSSTSGSSSNSRGGGHIGHFTASNNLAWDVWDQGTDWGAANTTPSGSHTFQVAQDPPSHGGESEYHALMTQQQPLYAGDYSGSHYHPDPHLVCLNLGKRHYFEDANVDGGDGIRRERAPVQVYGGDGAAVTVASTVGVPKCQVEGCHVALMNAKEYHRRHKVCEVHSKAPRVVVLGIEQRFCQQCSRFHAVSEFDDSKRSCRRRLAGHNERRRKGSHDSCIPKNPSQGRALSLLSSKNNAWLSASADFSTSGSAALHELIAENRAANFVRQVGMDRDNWPMNNQLNHSVEDNDVNMNSSHNNNIYSDPPSWDRYHDGPNGHVTLDLMQAQNSAFGMLSMRDKSKEEEEGCSEFMWRSFGGSH